MITANPTFNALIREAAFTKEILGTGATQIRRANYATPGVYAQAFAALSLGLERAGKLCVMLDHYIQNDGQFPDFHHMKNKIGHRLDFLQNEGYQIAQRRSIKFHFLNNLQHPIHVAILEVLNNYANGDRYSNINFLIGAKQQDDPISKWFSMVDIYVYENLVGERRKTKIVKNANIIHEMMSPIGIIAHTSETGTSINSFSDASFRGGMFEAVAPYRQLYVLQIIRYWTELIWELGRTAQELGRQEIPFLGEIFGAFYNDDAFPQIQEKLEYLVKEEFRVVGGTGTLFARFFRKSTTSARVARQKKRTQRKLNSRQASM